MEKMLDKNRPICPQIEELICVSVASGALKPGEKIPSVRELAVKFSVNPNTVQKALSSLEAKGILISMRGSGSFVSENTEKARAQVKSLVEAKTARYLSDMREYGLKTEEIIELIKERDQ